MNNLPKAKRVEVLINIIKDHNITSYEIAKNTGLSTVGIDKILKGETKSPTNATIEKIEKYVQGGIKGTDIKQNTINEPETVYGEAQSEIERLNKVNSKLIKGILNLELTLRQNKIDFKSPLDDADLLK